MSNDEELPLSQHDLLDPDDCIRICDRVIALKNCWAERSPGNFYTLGVASYLDATDRHDAYIAGARITNPVLRKNFDATLEQVRKFFEDFFGDTVFYDPHYALPGFHIFAMKGVDRSNDDVALRAHFDMQWMHAIPGHVPRGTLSFTLPIEQPSGGASMAIWPARYKDALRLGFTARDYAARHPWQRVTYECGRIVVHDGYVLHAIGPASDPAPLGYRITLQGHGVRTSIGWMLYW
jgi:hypothetical protein